MLDPGHAADHGVAADDRIVLDHDMAAEGGVVGHDDPVADLAVVGYVGRRAAPPVMVRGGLTRVDRGLSALLRAGA